MLNNIEFRNLKKDEILCRADIIGDKISVSLHCKAYVCTEILNETVGNANWEVEYTQGNKNCVVRVYNEQIGRFVSKENCCGKEPEFEGAKGQASNGFKRTCALGWGLGIELYSQPNIDIEITGDNIKVGPDGSVVPASKYFVSSIGYEGKHISSLEISDERGNVVFSFGKKKEAAPKPSDPMMTLPGSAGEKKENAEERGLRAEAEKTGKKTEEEKERSGKKPGEEVPVMKKDEGTGEKKEEGEAKPEGEDERRARLIEEVKGELKRTHVSEKSMLEAYGVGKIEEMKGEEMECCIKTLKEKPDYVKTRKK